jgi:hypothetical protein
LLSGCLAADWLADPLLLQALRQLQRLATAQDVVLLLLLLLLARLGCKPLCIAAALHNFLVQTALATAVAVVAHAHI